MKKMIVMAAVAVFACAAVNIMASGELPQRIQPAPKVEAAPKSLGHKLLWYIPNRVYDVLDVPRVNVGYGKGIGANAHATHDIQAGYAEYDSKGIAFDRGEFKSYDAKLSENGARFITWKSGTLLEREPSEVGLEAHALVGAGAGVSLDETIDFFGGLILLDPAEDDQ